MCWPSSGSGSPGCDVKDPGQNTLCLCTTDLCNCADQPRVVASQESCPKQQQQPLTAEKSGGAGRGSFGGLHAIGVVIWMRILIRE